MATIAERNKRLDDLQTAVKQYASQQRKVLSNRVDTCKKILQGRAGTTRLAQAAVDQSTSLVVVSINDFLTG